jgi:C4-dicarboxylate-specific signal transduction histidine kinase
MHKQAEEEIARLSAELVEQKELADVGELAGQVNHKFNNFLNSLLLRLALLEAEAPEAAAGKFVDIRLQAKQIAELIRQVHQFRRLPTTAAPIHDLNRLVERVVTAATDTAAPAVSARPSAIRLKLSPREAFVAGSAVDYQRLCSFLLRHRLTAPGSASRGLTVRTAVNQDKVLLTIEDNKANMTATQIADLFEPDTKAAEGTAHLVLAACKAIMRRLQGRICATPKGDNGLIIEAEFPLVSKT